MDVVTAINTHVKQGLADTFGMTMANMIVLQCSQKVGVGMMGLDSAGYMRLIDAIASDERVVQMLGQAGAQAKRTMWAALVSS